MNSFLVIIFTNLSLFLVIVPVLSIHITFAAPKVSVIDLFLIIRPFWASRNELRLRKIVKTIGNSSGTKAIASVTAFKMDGIRLYVV